MKLEEWKKIIRVLKIMKMNERKLKMFDKGIRKINTPIGEFCIISSESGITKVTSENYIENNLIGKKHLDKAEEWIFSYFNGIEIERPCLDYRRMTVFQKKVGRTMNGRNLAGRYISSFSGYYSFSTSTIRRHWRSTGDSWCITSSSEQVQV